MVNRTRLQILIGFFVVVCAIATLIWWLRVKNQSAQTTINQSSPTTTSPLPSPAEEASSASTPAGEITSQQPTPSTQSTGTPGSDAAHSGSAPSSSSAPSINSAKLLIPVAGVRPDQLQDTFKDARSEGREHDAIDIMAPRGTPVLATADGRIVKLFYSEKGGITIYQLANDSKMIYYYAHLERYADGLAEGHYARQGEVIGYVGDTGNSTPGNYHLHFAISIVDDPNQWWGGVAINPYPLLRGNEGMRDEGKEGSRQ